MVKFRRLVFIAGTFRTRDEYEIYIFEFEYNKIQHFEYWRSWNNIQKFSLFLFL